MSGRAKKGRGEKAVAAPEGPFAALSALRASMNAEGDADLGSDKSAQDGEGARMARKKNSKKKLNKIKLKGKGSATAPRVPFGANVSRHAMPIYISTPAPAPEPAAPRTPSYKRCAEEVDAWLVQRLASGQLAPPIMDVVPKAEDEREMSARADAGRGFAAYPEDEQDYVVLGFDFGTTSTKIVAGMPYVPGEPIFPVPAPEGLRAEGHAHLFHSVVWIDRSGRFHLAPGQGRKVLPDLKRDLLGGRPSCAGSEQLFPITPAEGVAAFVALQVRQARGWLLLKSGAIRADTRYAWLTHIGLPAAALEGETSGTARIAVAAGIALANSVEPVTIEVVRSFVGKALADPEHMLAMEGGAIFPEISAAVAGFATSRKMEAGLYGLVDIGGLTLDCCTFDLRPTNTGIGNPIFEARVNFFGVETWRDWLESGGEAEIFDEAVKYPIRSAIWTTRSDRQPQSERWESQLPLFLTGGGAASIRHRALVGSTDFWLRKQEPRSKGVKIMALEPPENLIGLACPASQAHRLNVAIGLSRPGDQIPKSALPGEIENTPRPRQHEANFVGPEQT